MGTDVYTVIERKVIIMDHINYFKPYERKKGWHEDQLTRAFLVILKYIPMAQAIFIDTIRENQLSSGSKCLLPPLTEVGSCLSKSPMTQTSDIDLEEGKLVSVLLSDVPWNRDFEVTWGSKKLRHDGVIYYGENHVITIENKLNVAKYNGYQLHPWLKSVEDPSKVEIDPIYVNITWRDIIRRLSALEQDGLILGAEEKLVDDFMDFIDSTDRLSGLNPYDRFSLCKDRKKLLLNRCRSIMNRLDSGDVQYHRGWHYYVKFDGAAKMVAIYPVMEHEQEEWGIRIAIYPGDTMCQARSLYQKLNSTELLKLKNEGWSIAPNLHLSHISKQLVSTNVSADLKDYIQYWKMHQDEIVQIRQCDFKILFEKLCDLGFMNKESDIPKAEKHFINTGRQSLNLCPGLALTYTWDKSKASAIDDEREAFVKEARKRIDEAFACWRQKTPWQQNT